MRMLSEFLADISHAEIARNVLATVLALVLIIFIRGLIARSVERSDLPSARRRQFMVQTRNGAILLFFATAAIIWAQQLQTVALSLAAIAVALVVATKELILCLSGALLRFSGHGFSLGDRIEINGLRGDVIDIGALTTTLLEVGPGPSIHKGTGRTIVLPNSMFLSMPVTNETFTDAFVLHATTVPVAEGDDWEQAERALLEAAVTETAPFLDEARRNMERIARKHGLDTPSVEPRIWLKLVNPKQIELIVRFPSPSRARGQVEQAVLRRFLHALRSKTAVSSDSRTSASELPSPPS